MTSSSFQIQKSPFPKQEVEPPLFEVNGGVIWSWKDLQYICNAGYVSWTSPVHQKQFKGTKASSPYKDAHVQYKELFSRITMWYTKSDVQP